MCGRPIAGPGAARGPAVRARHLPAERDFIRRYSRRRQGRRSISQATSILPPLNVKTARSWRGIVTFTHLAPEGRMTVTIGRRELLAALGGAAAAWPLVAQQAERWGMC